MSGGEVHGPKDWRPLTHAPVPVIMQDMPTEQCAAIKDNGDQCLNRSVHGQIFCASHGGNTLQVQDQTRRRLDTVRSTMFDKLVDAANEAVDTYITIMRHGKKDSDRLKAADRVLEMLGVRDQVIEVKHTHSIEPTDLEAELLGLLKNTTKEKIAGIIDIEEHPEAQEVA